MLAKRVVTFFKNESKEVLKYTVNHFKKENVPVRTVYNIITRYRKHNSTNYLPKAGTRKYQVYSETKVRATFIGMVCYLYTRDFQSLHSSFKDCYA